MQLNELLSEFHDSLFSNNISTDVITPLSSITIYKNNIRNTLKNSLTEVYPLIFKLIGSDAFHCVAEEYIKQYPSRDSNLREYGAHFSSFLITQPQSLPYLREVAEFEWAVHQIYFAADASHYDATKLANTPHPFLHATLHPASKLMSFQHPILDIISSCKNEKTDPINLHSGGVELLIIRRDVEIVLSTLATADFYFLNTLQHNGSLQLALDEALVFDEAFNLQEKLSEYILNKTIVDLFIQD